MHFNITLLSMFAQIRRSIPFKFYGKYCYATLSSSALGQYLAHLIHKSFKNK